LSLTVGWCTSFGCVPELVVASIFHIFKHPNGLKVCEIEILNFNFLT
jgi:hypothetical protein